MHWESIIWLTSPHNAPAALNLPLLPIIHFSMGSSYFTLLWHIDWDSHSPVVAVKVLTIRDWEANVSKKWQVCPWVKGCAGKQDTHFANVYNCASTVPGTFNAEHKHTPSRKSATYRFISFSESLSTSCRLSWDESKDTRNTCLQQRYRNATLPVTNLG